jgi:hypothetical protein
MAKLAVLEGRAEVEAMAVLAKGMELMAGLEAAKKMELAVMAKDLEQEEVQVMEVVQELVQEEAEAVVGLRLERLVTVEELHLEPTLLGALVCLEVTGEYTEHQWP